MAAPLQETKNPATTPTAKEPKTEISSSSCQPTLGFRNIRQASAFPVLWDGAGGAFCKGEAKEYHDNNDARQAFFSCSPFHKSHADVAISAYKPK